MSGPKRISAYWLGFAMIIVVLIAFDVHASGDRETNVTTGDTTIGDTLVGGSESIGIGFGMGDVDIAQCMYTKGTPLYQWGKYNKWCMADSLDSRGLYSAAATLRCSIKEVAKVFGSTCIDALTARERAVSVPLPAPVTDKDDEDAHDISALYARLSDLESQRSNDAANAKKAAQRANAAAVRVNKAEADRKEYAQQAYEELQEWK